MKIKVLLIVGFFLIPNLSPAVGLVFVCSKTGYTVVTINGVFTNESEAARNATKLSDKVGDNFNGEHIVVKYLLNPSHLAGLGDIVKTIEQGLFDTETVDDYDLTEMQKSASEKVKTQKLLLVAHSQGNFYANAFYKRATAPSSDGASVPLESIGVDSVATPSS